MFIPQKAEGICSAEKTPAHPSTWSDGKRGVRKKICWCPPNYSKMLPHQCAKNQFPALIVPLGSPGMGCCSLRALPARIPLSPEGIPACFAVREGETLHHTPSFSWEGAAAQRGMIIVKSDWKGDDRQIQMWNFSARGRRVIRDYHNI